MPNNSLPILDEQQVERLRELLFDAESCARLLQWEEEFLDDMRSRFLVHAEKMRISDKQWEILRRIEEKVYA
jgi:hypothetical protein